MRGLWIKIEFHSIGFEGRILEPEVLVDGREYTVQEKRQLVEAYQSGEISNEDFLALFLTFAEVNRQISRLFPETLSRFPRPPSLENLYVARWADYRMAC